MSELKSETLVSRRKGLICVSLAARRFFHVRDGKGACERLNEKCSGHYAIVGINSLLR